MGTHQIFVITPYKEFSQMKHLICVAVLMCSVTVGTEQPRAFAGTEADPASIVSRLRESGARLQTNDHGQVSEVAFLHGPVADKFLDELQHLHGLRGLYLSDSVTDLQMRHLSPLTSLEWLYLGFNTQITDRGLRHIAGLTQLQTLYLESTPVTDDGLVHLAKLQNLRVLNLEQTEVTDAGLAHLQTLISLTHLKLSGPITDDGLVHLSGLRNMQRIYMFGTEVTEQGVRRLEKYLPETRLFFHGYQVQTEPGGAPPRDYSIPLIDLASETHRQVIVDREPGQYLGHPTTVLLDDGRTIVIVYPAGHGKGRINLKRSSDGGLTWSERLPTPANWAASDEVPTIYPTIDPQGKKRLLMFSNLYPFLQSISEDDGLTWTLRKPVGNFGGSVMAGMIRLRNGHYMALSNNSRRFVGATGLKTDRFQVFKFVSADGGVTWGPPVTIARHPKAHLCEPGVIRSPDGKHLAVLMRENSRKFNSFVIFSDDEGESWTEPRELPGALTGDRHNGKYAPDGRLFITFRDTTHESPTRGDWVGWVGTWDDIANGREGQYRVRLMENHKGADCAYSGLELLPDGTFVATTYGHWTRGEKAYIVSVRFTLAELDDKASR